MKSIHDIRRDNLRLLIDRRFGGSQTRLAQAVGIRQPSFVSRLLTDREGTRQNIGNRLARRVESALGLEPNWLDTPDVGARGAPGVNLDFDLGFDLVSPEARRPGPQLTASAQWRPGQARLFTATELAPFTSIAAALAARSGGEMVAVRSKYASPHLLAVRLPDDAMAERFPAGSVVVVTDDKVPRTNDFVVGVLPGAPVASMRQWVEAAQQRFLLPLNRAYPAAEAGAGFVLLGVVIEAIQFFE